MSLILKVTNNSGGTVSNVVDGGAQYISVTSVIANATNVITHYKADNSGSYVAVPTGHKVELGSIARSKSFAALLSSSS